MSGHETDRDRLAGHTAEEKRAVADITDRIVKNLTDMATSLARECKHPPCQHALGVTMAAANVRDLFTAYVNEGVPSYPNPIDPPQED